MEQFISLYKSTQRCLKDISQTCEFTVPEMTIMLELIENKTVSLNELSERIELPKSSVSRFVDRLVNRGFISRVIPKENRRSVELSATSLNCIEELCVNEVLLEKLKKEDIDEILAAMQELTKILTNKGEQ